MTDTCPTCGVDMDSEQVVTAASTTPIHTIRWCPNRCQPPPTAGQMQRAADEAWLNRHRRLAEETR